MGYAVGGVFVWVIHMWLGCSPVIGVVGLVFVACLLWWGYLVEGMGGVVSEGLCVDSYGVDVVCGVLRCSAYVAGGVVGSVFEGSGSVEVTVGEISRLLVVRQWVLAGVLESLAWEAHRSVASLVQADQQLAAMGR